MRNEKTREELLLDQLVTKTPLIKWIEERLQRDERLGINIGLQEGLILKGLCSQLNVEKVVEIGTQYGCSASWMAMGLKGRGKLYTFEKDEQCLSESQITFQHQDFLDLNCPVIQHGGAALDKLPLIEGDGPFDLIFIDANKSAYLDYLHWAKNNITSNGVIVIDNIYLFGTVFESICPPKTPEKMWRVMKSVLKEQFEDDDYNTSIIPTSEGLLLSYKIAPGSS